jgi:C-terminal processing protease CtpA/Prc
MASFRSLQMDTATLTATLILRSFANGEGKHLKRFLKRAFKSMAQQKTKNLIIDLRNNGGGDVTRAALLAQYLRDSAFRVADTAYALAKNFRPFTPHIHHGFFNNIALFFLTKKQQDGAYHFGFWERHWYQPKIKRHFNGPVYVLINGFSFSATSIFCNLVKGQENIKLVGEETGGGAYGNSGLLIPDLELPNTKLKVRLPFFKVVQFHHGVKDGLGIAPDIFIPLTVEGIKNGEDRKMQMVKALLEKKENSFSQ